MERSAIIRRVNLLACVFAAAGMLACGEMDEQALTSEASVCTDVRVGSAWWNQPFSEQAGRFHVEFVATPSASNIDAVVGLSNGAASGWPKLAAIVRFNPSGMIDARAGNTYRADRAYPYYAGQAYRVRLDVSLTSRTYSVWVSRGGGDYYELVGRDFAFRTEQATVTRLNNVASYLEPSRPGSLQVCGFKTVFDDTTADGCMASSAGSGFANAQVASATGAMAASFAATPSAPNMDGVVGFANGRVDAYNDLAASIRFATNGTIEVRDGDTYRADAVVPYTGGSQYSFHLIADLPTKTYSVLVTNWDTGSGYVEIARGYRFRPQQQGVTLLDHGATVVASTTGAVKVCRTQNTAPPELAFARPGHHVALPLANGEVLISTNARTQRLDAAGRTLTTAPIGGQLAVGSNGNVYVGNVTDGTLMVTALTPALATLWSRTFTVSGDAVRAMGVYITGEIAIAVSQGDRPIQLIRLRSDGSEYTRQNLEQFSTTAIAFSPGRFTIARPLGEGVAIEAYSPDGALLWQRSWSGHFSVSHMAHDPAVGLVFTGEFSSTVNFGDGPLEPRYNPEGSQSTFLVSLAHNGTLRFSKHVFTTMPRGVASNGNRIALSADRWTQSPWVELHVFDAAGTAIRMYSGVDDPEQNGHGGPVAVGPSGRVLATLALKFSPSALAPTWPFLFAFDP